MYQYTYILEICTQNVFIIYCLSLTSYFLIKRNIIDMIIQFNGFKFKTVLKKTVLKKPILLPKASLNLIIVILR